MRDVQRSPAEAPAVAAPEKAERGRRRLQLPARARRPLDWGKVGPWSLVIVAVAFNLWTLRAEVLPVQNLNDSSVHLAMVRWARDRVETGHLPLDGWFPYLSLGSSRFHHYQSLPHVLTGSLGALLDTDRVFSWSLYLLLSLWPLGVYGSARLLGWGRWTSGLSGLVSPLLVSTPGLGYEYGSYTWRGSGTWTQLWGMWLLPISWALTWRAIARGGSYALPALTLALTMATHLLTGYLALLSIGVWALLAPSEVVRRAGRAAVVGVGALLIASWMLVPLIADSRWAIQDEFSRGRFFYDSFGARRVLGWLFTGQIFDAGRVPVITLLAAAGAAVCIARFRRDERARVLLLGGALSLLLFFGRPTLGPLLDLLPGSRDMFFRRYVIGVHLAGILLAGVGAGWLWGLALGRARSLLGSVPRGLAAAALAVVTVAVLAPAWSERASFHSQGARWIEEQRAADATEGAQVAALIEEAEAMGPGRIYAGTRSNWGVTYRVGFVPVYTVLLNHAADGVGFTRPTWSLSSGIEARFDERNPAHYDLYNVRYLILPTDRRPEVPATLVDRRGRHTLWVVRSGGYLRVVDTTSPIAADRTNLGQRMDPWLRSDLVGRNLHPTVAFADDEGAPPTASAGSVLPIPPGSVEEELVGLADGVVAGRVTVVRPAMVMLKASFDPRWRVVVDGIATRPQMVAPSFVGRTVPPGEHSILFLYVPFPNYRELLAVGVATLLVLALGPRAIRGVRRRS